MTPPLTDEICEELSSWQLDILDPHLAHEERSDMRASADWQLEQVIRWLSEQGYYFVETDGEGNFLDNPEPTYVLLDCLKKAMRPQVVDLPQANSDVCGEEGIERARQQTFEENDELMRKLSDS